ncbi:hypothetical protein G7Y89_g1825 [Cudoniella acicularis]|uniref:Zn(2)-C6 fungal-type domain-containing protein n=1 Tax=Cudoniella acicularis TaxID=354080 RepID=A0A8H4RXF8_9HELO|nr:hypothetical protein G7Y89_g1825 [Cudoniella acicularis]
MELVDRTSPPMSKKAPAAQQLPQQKQGDLHKEKRQFSSQKKKLRESCNSCATSKVKCSRDQPICARCEDREIICQYSPSKRTGKKRKARVSDAFSADLNRSNTAPRTFKSPSNLNYQTIGLNYAPKNVTTWDSPRNHYPGAVWGTGVGSEAPFVRGSQTSTTSIETPGSWEEKTFDVNVHTGQSGPMPYYNPGYNEPGFLGSCDDANLNNPNIDTLLRGSDRNDPAAAFDSSTPILTPDSDRRSSSADSNDFRPQPRSHDCMSVVLEIIQSLHVAPVSCASFARGGHQSSPQTPTIDRALATNKDIIDSIGTILECSCSLDPQLYLILTLVASKIISWYSAIARCDDPTTNNRENSGPKSKQVSEHVRYLPITVGIYHLEGANEATMRAQLVLSELHRAVGLVGQLAQRFNQAEVPQGYDELLDGSARDEKSAARSMGAELEAFLLFRMRSITTQTMEVLRNA